MDDSAERIEVFSNLTVRVGARTLLERGTLEVKKGTVTVLMGPSGSGKSVLSDLVFGKEKRGAVIEAGAISEAAREQGAFVFQEGGGVPHLNVRANLSVTGANCRNCKETAKAYGLEMNTLGSMMSGGERRRLAVARAVLAQRELIWLDEPDAGLDVARIDELAGMLRTEAEKGLAIVVITHSTQLATAVAAERVLVLGHKAKFSELDVVAFANDAMALEQALKNCLSSSDEGLKEIPVDLPRQKIAKGEGALVKEVWRYLKLLLAAMLWAPSIAVTHAAQRAFGRAFMLVAVRGALYYLFIGTLFGGVFILVFIFSELGVRPDSMIATFGHMIVERLSPPIAAILATAVAGSTIAAWVGQMAVQRQLDGIELIGISVNRFVLIPIWWGLVVGSVISTIMFAAGMTATMAAYVITAGTLLGEFLGGFETQMMVRALLKALCYAVLLATITIGFASAALRAQDEVSAAITRGIVWSSLIVMTAELVALVEEQLVSEQLLSWLHS